jgi:hypothetical protein
MLLKNTLQSIWKLYILRILQILPNLKETNDKETGYTSGRNRSSTAINRYHWRSTVWRRNPGWRGELSSKIDGAWPCTLRASVTGTGRTRANCTIDNWKRVHIDGGTYCRSHTAKPTGDTYDYVRSYRRSSNFFARRPIPGVHYRNAEHPGFQASGTQFFFYYRTLRYWYVNPFSWNPCSTGATPLETPVSYSLQLALRPVILTETRYSTLWHVHLLRARKLPHKTL